MRVLKELIKLAFSVFGYQIVYDRRFGIDHIKDIKHILSNAEANVHLHKKSVEIIFDVGANIGQTATAYAKAFPGSEIYCFEPIQETFDQLEQNVKKYKNIHTFCKGLGKVNEDKDIYVYSMGVLASCVLESPLLSSKDSVNKATIKLESIDSFCLRKNIQSIDLLKVDTEGFDFDVIQGAEKLLQQQMINFIYFEFFYIGDDNVENSGGRLIDIHNYLTKFNYRPVTTYTDLILWHRGAGAYNALYMRW